MKIESYPISRMVVKTHVDNDVSTTRKTGVDRRVQFVACNVDDARMFTVTMTEAELRKGLEVLGVLR